MQGRLRVDLSKGFGFFHYTKLKHWPNEVKPIVNADINAQKIRYVFTFKTRYRARHKFTKIISERGVDLTLTFRMYLRLNNYPIICLKLIYFTFY